MPVLYHTRDEILKEVVKNSFALKYASDELRDDEAIVMAAVRYSGWAIEYASNRLQKI